MDKKLQVLKDGLGNGLKFFKGENKTPYELTGINSWMVWSATHKDPSGNTHVPIGYVRPILFPFDLEKPITIGGETFVPFNVLLKYSHSFDEYELVRCYIKNHDGGFNIFYNTGGEDDDFLLGFDFDSMDRQPLWIIEKLNEWHINWRGLPSDQFIDASTGNYY